MANDSPEKGFEQQSNSRDSVDSSGLQAEFLNNTSWSNKDSSSGKQEMSSIAERTNAMESKGTLPKLEIGNSHAASEKSGLSGDGKQAKPSSDSKPSSSKEGSHVPVETAPPPLSNKGSSHGPSLSRDSTSAEASRGAANAGNKTGESGMKS